MDKKIDTWKIARGILLMCDARSDIDKCINTIQNQKLREELIRILRKINDSLESQIVVNDEKRPMLDSDMRHNQEVVLGNLFRDRLHMSNQEVEIWLANRFGIKQRIGKTSLREYLQAILKKGPQDLSNGILSQAYKEFPSIIGTDSNLRLFWKGLDDRSSGENNVSIQRQTNEFPSQPK